MPNSKPLRVFEGTAEPHQPFWKMRMNTDEPGSGPEIEFYGYISEYSWFEDDITPKMFKDDLYQAGNGGPVTVRMNSGGGDVFAASVIRSTLVDYPGKVTVRIDGLAASAATIVAMAGDKVRMQDTAYFMIHDPSTLVWGNIDELKQVLEILKTVKEGIMDAYETRSKMGREKLSKLMTAETWMTANQAVEWGFVDEVISDPKRNGNASALKNVAVVNALRSYQNLPKALQNLLKQDLPSQDLLQQDLFKQELLSPAVVRDQLSAVESPDVIRLRAEAKLYKGV